MIVLVPRKGVSDAPASRLANRKGEMPVNSPTVRFRQDKGAGGDPREKALEHALAFCPSMRRARLSAGEHPGRVNVTHTFRAIDLARILEVVAAFGGGPFRDDATLIVVAVK